MQKVKIFQNGFRLVVNENPASYSVSTGICVGVGSCFEDSTNNGFSHFIEHMMFKGTTRRTAFEISDSMDKIGGKINAFTSKDLTCYFARTASSYAENAVEILSDMFFNSLFDEEEMEREKKVVLEEMTMGEDQPDEVCQDLIAEAIFGEHPLGQTIIGTSKIIEGASRGDLLKFISKYYSADNVVLSFAGKIKYDKAVEFAEKYFLPFFKLTGKIAKLDSAKYQSKFLSKVKDVEQAHVSIAFPSLPYGDKLLPSANVFTGIFGGGMSSRLFQEVREKHGMAYSVYAFNSYYVNNGYFEIYAGTNPKNIDKVLSLIKNEIQKVISEGISEDELLRGKEQLKGSLLLSQESSVSVMTSLGRDVLRNGKVISVKKQIANIDAVSMASINMIINKIFNKKHIAMAIVCKDKTDEKLLREFSW